MRTVKARRAPLFLVLPQSPESLKRPSLSIPELDERIRGIDDDISELRNSRSAKDQVKSERLARYQQTLAEAASGHYGQLISRLSSQRTPVAIDDALRELGHQSVNSSNEVSGNRSFFVASDNHSSLSNTIRLAKRGLRDTQKLGVLVLDSHVDTQPIGDETSQAIQNIVPNVGAIAIAGEELSPFTELVQSTLGDEHSKKVLLHDLGPHPSHSQIRSIANSIVNGLSKKGITHMLFSIDADVLDSRRNSGFLYHPINSLLSLNRNSTSAVLRSYYLYDEPIHAPQSQPNGSHYQPDYWFVHSPSDPLRIMNEGGVHEQSVRSLLIAVAKAAKKRGISIGVPSRSGRLIGELTELRPAWDEKLRTTRRLAGMARALSNLV
jgi:hypothetical protein